MMPITNENAPHSGQAGEASQQNNLQAQFCYPDPKTVKGRVLGAHLRGESLTHLDCWLRFGSSRLAHHEMMLRRLGWVIEMREETVKTSDAGRAATIGRYSLSANVIAAAGQIGRAFAETCALVEAERRAA